MKSLIHKLLSLITKTRIRGLDAFTGPQPNRNNNNRGNNWEEVADSIVDAWDIINARRRAQLADNSDRFQALSKDFDNNEYPKDFKPTNIQKYDGKQDPAQWLHLYSTAVSVAGGDTNTKVLYFPMALEPAPLTWLESLARECYRHKLTGLINGPRVSWA